MTPSVRSLLASAFRFVPLAALLFLPGTTFGALNMTELGRLGGGSAFQLATYGNYGYLAAGDRVQIFDLSTPASPVLAAEFKVPAPSWKPVQAALVAAGYLYIARGADGFQIYNLADPLQPTFVSEFQGGANRLARRPGNLFVGGQAGFRIYDITTAGAPVLKGTWSEPNVEVADFELSGNRAYLATSELDWDVYVTRLVVLDISDLENPAFLGRWDPQSMGGEGRVAVLGNIAFLGAYTTIFAVDMTYPGSPYYGGSFSSDDDVTDLTVSGTRLILANKRGLRSYSISSFPPAPLDNLDLWGTGGAGLVSGNLLYQASGVGGLDVVDIQDMSNLLPLTHLNAPSFTSDITLNGNLAYVSGESFFVVDLEDPAHPAVVDELPVAGYRSVIAGDRLYLAGVDQGIVVFDISDPAQPLEITRFQTSGWVWDLRVQDGLVYCSERLSRLAVYDFADPLNPVLIGSLPLPSPGYIGLNGPYLYVNHFNGTGFDVIDISTPSSPVLTGSVPTDGIALDLEVRNDRLYVAAAVGGFKIFDVSDKALPVLLESWSAPGPVHGLDIEGDLVFLAAYGGGVRVLNVQDPLNPVEIAWHETPTGDNVRDVVVRGELVVAAVSTGVATYSVDGAVAAAGEPPRAGGELTVRPNPFRDSASIRFRLDGHGAARVLACDVSGRQLRAWDVLGSPGSGSELAWDGTDSQGRDIVAGIYFIRVTTSEGSRTLRVVRER